MTCISRRQSMLLGLFGSGYVGLRALATGLPPLFFSAPRRAMAQTRPRMQYLILSTSSAGDPLNCNAPGTYDLPADYPASAFIHPADSRMAPTKMRVGTTEVTAAAPWASMDEQVLARTAFVHHATMTANHGDQNNVMRLMGAMRRGQMATSAMARQLAAGLGTIQTQPLALSREVTQVDGQYQPLYTPLGIKSLLQGTKGPLGVSSLQKLRDAELKRLSDLLRQSRNTKAELAFLDSLANSQQQMRRTTEAFGDDLAKLAGNGANDQCTAAALLAKMKVAPMYTVNIGFGGDNHSDPNYAGETAATVSGVATINQLMATLKNQQIEDQVTFATLNVFGRTFAQSTPGRGHNGGHHVTVAIGANVQAGIIGALGPDGRAMNIDPTTGAAVASGGIALGDSLVSVGKSLSRILGVDAATFDEEVTGGQVIAGMLRA